jgi:hypothetical protein
MHRIMEILLVSLGIGWLVHPIESDFVRIGAYVAVSVVYAFTE